MKYFKLVVLSIIFIFLLFTIISLFIPSRILLPKSIDINAGRSMVMQKVSDPMKWKEWYPGADSIHMTEITDTLVRAEIIRKEKKVTTYWQVDSLSPASSKIYWYMDFKTRWYPWEKIASLMYEKVYGTQMEKGLLKLKSNLEN